MAKPISAQMFAAVPTGDDDEVIFQSFPLQHAQDHHPGTGFAIIPFQRAGV